MTCLSQEELLALLDDESSEAVRPDGESHVGECEGCRAAFEELVGEAGAVETWNRLLRSNTDDDTPVDLIESLKTAVRPLTLLRRPEAWPELPGYTITSVLGRGGMGIVYAARQSQLGRTVALKTTTLDRQADSGSRERFRTEAAAVARLRHPNIVQIFETGEHEGLAYFSMEFVEGGTLASSLANGPLSSHAAATLLEPVARAVQHAHERGIVHRDLKPGNLLLADDGQPKVADFGLAAVLDEGADARDRTKTGAIFGTPDYMSPEQAEGRRAEIGPATDIHALGAILYAMLVGHPPFAAASSLHTLLRVRFDEAISPRRLNPAVPRDLETVCMKCLAKLPGDRYSSAKALADDLQRFREGRPVLARPVSALTRGAKWVRRHPVVSSLSSAVAGLVVVALVLLSLAQVSARNAERAEHEKRIEVDAAREETDRALVRTQRAVYFGAIGQARSQWQLNDVGSAELHLESCRPELRGWEWNYLRSLNHGDLRTIADAATPYLNAVAYDPSGKSLVVGGGDPHAQTGSIRVFDVSSGTQRWKVELPRTVWAATFSPDGTRLATLGGNAQRFREPGLCLWNATSGKLILELPGHAVRDSGGLVAFSPDGSQLAVRTSDGGVSIRDATDGRELHRVRHDAPIGHLAFDPLGKFFATGGDDGLRIWDVDTAKPLRHFPQMRSNFALAPGGRQLACVVGSRIEVWNIDPLLAETAATLIDSFSNDGASPISLAFHPDGEMLAVGATDGTIRLRDPTARVERGILRGHVGRVASLAFHPEGRVLASGSQDSGAAKIWDLTRLPECEAPVQFAREFRDIDAIGFSEGGRTLLALGKGGILRAWDSETGTSPSERKLPFSNQWLTPANLAAFSGDGSRLAGVTFSDTREIQVFDPSTGTLVSRLQGHTSRVWHIALDCTGRRAATASLAVVDGKPQRELRIWDVSTGKALRVETTANSRTRSLAISPNGTHFAEAVKDSTLSVVAIDKPGSAPVRLAGLTGIATAITFSADGQRIVAATTDGSLRIWKLDGTPLHERSIRGFSGIQGLAFNPTGDRVAGVSRDRAAIWDVLSGEHVLSLRGADARPTDNGYNPAIAWSPDGLRVAATQWDQSVRVWDATDPTTPRGRQIAANRAESRAFDWHRKRAELLDNPGSDAASKIHVTRLDTLKLTSPAAFRARGDFHARRGEWTKAVSEYANANSDPLADSAEDWEAYAVLLLKTGDRKRYLEIRSKSLVRFADCQDSGLLERIVRPALFAPIEPQGAESMLVLARRLVELRPHEPHLKWYLGMALVRAERWSESTQHLKNDHERNDAYECAALAFVKSHMGDETGAKALRSISERWCAEYALGLKAHAGTARTFWDWKRYLEITSICSEVQPQRK